MHTLLLLLLLSVLGCTTGTPALAPPSAPDPRSLLQDETDVPSFYRLKEIYFEPHWM